MNQKISTNPLNKRKHVIPEILNDKQNIDFFLNNNFGKKVVVVQGLGFVGAVMSIVCANSLKDNYAVIGVDLPDEKNFWKINTINNGEFPLQAEDNKIDIYFKKTLENGNFYATYDEYAYSKADVIIVDINLDVKKTLNNDSLLENFDVDLSSFKAAIKTIGSNCVEEVLVVVETTVPPGTCEKIVKPILIQELKDRGLNYKKLKIGHSYERVMPGPNYIDSIQNFPRVYSGINDKSIKATKEFLETIINTNDYPLMLLNGTNATEMAKVLENSYRAMNIAFIVEWSRFAEQADVNLYEVVEAIRQRDTHSNMMLPGLGVGGYCLTKDPLLASWSKQKIFKNSPLKMSENAVKINDQMPRFAFDFFKNNYLYEISGKNVVFLGVSYRGDVGDTRFSPVEKIYDLFIKENAIVHLHDPIVSFWEEKKISVGKSIEELFKNEVDIIVIATGHSFYKTDQLLSLLLKKDKLTIFDTIGLLTKEQIHLLKKKHELFVLGRGDH
jgi:UDP-N-acetyl-D-glucosamine dehydrogenase